MHNFQQPSGTPWFEFLIGVPVMEINHSYFGWGSPGFFQTVYHCGDQTYKLIRCIHKYLRASGYGYYRKDKLDSHHIMNC